MALSALIHKNKSEHVAALTITTQTQHPAPTVAKVVTVVVANPQASKNTQLSIAARQKLLSHVKAIGETDQASIDELLNMCENDSGTLAKQLQQIDDCLQINSGDYTGLVQCSGCRQLSGDTCQLHRWRAVVDKWRRCDDYDALQKTPGSALVTCKPCRHFQSYYAHGGGGGNCSAGVQPFGVCWWADTIHQCEKYQVLESEKSRGVTDGS